VRALLAGVAVGLAVAVAASRVLLDVHWLTDVIAGLALGWAWFSVCSIAFGGRLLRFGAGAEIAARAMKTASLRSSPGASRMRTS
jgi:undecaprenyl-diphosphatase